VPQLLREVVTVTLAGPDVKALLANTDHTCCVFPGTDTTYLASSSSFLFNAFIRLVDSLGAGLHLPYATQLLELTIYVVRTSYSEWTQQMGRVEDGFDDVTAEVDLPSIEDPADDGNLRRLQAGKLLVGLLQVAPLAVIEAELDNLLEFNVWDVLGPLAARTLEAPHLHSRFYNFFARMVSCIQDPKLLHLYGCGVQDDYDGDAEEQGEGGDGLSTTVLRALESVRRMLARYKEQLDLSLSCSFPLEPFAVLIVSSILMLKNGVFQGTRVNLELELDDMEEGEDEDGNRDDKSSDVSSRDSENEDDDTDDDGDDDDEDDDHSDDGGEKALWKDIDSVVGVLMAVGKTLSDAIDSLSQQNIVTAINEHLMPLFNRILSMFDVVLKCNEV
jgi:hypothetical protein